MYLGFRPGVRHGLQTYPLEEPSLTTLEGTRAKTVPSLVRLFHLRHLDLGLVVPHRLLAQAPQILLTAHCGKL